MTSEEAIERTRERQALDTLDTRDVEERLAIRLEDDAREFRVVDVDGHVRAFVHMNGCSVEAPCATCSGGGEACEPKWRSMYVRALSDVDRFLDGASR